MNAAIIVFGLGLSLACTADAYSMPRWHPLRSLRLGLGVAGIVIGLFGVYLVARGR